MKLSRTGLTVKHFVILLAALIILLLLCFIYIFHIFIVLGYGQPIKACYCYY